MVSFLMITLLPIVFCSSALFKSRLMQKTLKTMTSNMPPRLIVPSSSSKVINIDGFPIIPIIYEDDDILIIDKPTGMLSVPGNIDGPEPVIKPQRFEEWRTSIKAAYELTPDDSPHKPILQRMTTMISIPRKRKFFATFLERTCRVDDVNLAEAIYNQIVLIDEELHAQKFREIPFDRVGVTHLTEEYVGHRLFQAHRLDMETSGIFVQAKHDRSCGELCRQFRDRDISKAYVAKVYGKVPPSLTKIEVPIKPDYARRPIQIVDYENGKPSETLVKILDYDVIDGKDVTLVHLTPVTGRTHQLRLHMECQGHPILGDPLYGSLESKTLCSRLCLHAFYIKFNHPMTNEELEISLPPTVIPRQVCIYIEGTMVISSWMLSPH